MKKFFVYTILVMAIAIDSCKNVEYDWEKYATAATPKVTVNLEKSALPTFATAKISFFNMKEVGYATKQQFEWTLSYNDFGRTTVKSIEVYLSFNKKRIEPSYLPDYLFVSRSISKYSPVPFAKYSNGNGQTV